MTVGHPHPPERVRPGVEAWKQGLIEAGIDPKDRHCQFHVRTHVNASAARAQDIGKAAVQRYDEISRIGRRSLTAAPAVRLGLMLQKGETIAATPAR
jgi:hypothetical protein